MSCPVATSEAIMFHPIVISMAAVFAVRSTRSSFRWRPFLRCVPPDRHFDGGRSFRVEMADPTISTWKTADALMSNVTIGHVGDCR